MARHLFVTASAAFLVLAQAARVEDSQTAGLPPVKQEGDKDCGPTCVRNVLRLSGVDVSAEEIYAKYSADYDGNTETTIEENEKVLQEYGFATHVCMNAYMQQEWLLQPQHYQNGEVEAYIMWYVNEPGSCNHFVLAAALESVKGESRGNVTVDWCNIGKKSKKCREKFDVLREWTYFDPWTADELVQPKTFDQFPNFGKELLSAYLQGHQYNPNKGSELLAGIIVTKGLKRDIPCSAPTSHGKAYELPSKEGCARSGQSARPA